MVRIFRLRSHMSFSIEPGVPTAAYRHREAAIAAAQAVAAVRPWGKKDEILHRIRIPLLGPRRRRVLKNNRAARRNGYVSNDVALSLPYNTVHESSLDARSLEQRSGLSWDEGEQDRPQLLDDQEIRTCRKEHEILPVLLWSMGKSFHSGNRDSHFVLMEVNHAKTHPSGRHKLANKLRSKLNLLGQSGREYGLVAWSLPLPFIVGTQSGRWACDRFLALAYFLGCPIIDRTDTFNHQMVLKLVNLHPIPRRPLVFNKTLETIMLERARDALEQCKNRGNTRIYLLWSGGIDTTAMVCVFARVTEGDDAARQLLL